MSDGMGSAIQQPLIYEDDDIKDIFTRTKTIAMPGASANTMRPSYFVMLYLINKGFEVWPVNPGKAGDKILGRTVYADMQSLPGIPDMIDVFRRPESVPAIADEAIRLGAKTLWLQLGIRHDGAAAKAKAAGLNVVMDRCTKIEYGRLFGEIGWLGVNRQIISARRSQAKQLKP